MVRLRIFTPLRYTRYRARMARLLVAAAVYQSRRRCRCQRAAARTYVIARMALPLMFQARRDRCEVPLLSAPRCRFSAEAGDACHTRRRDTLRRMLLICYAIEALC